MATRASTGGTGLTSTLPAGTEGTFFISAAFSAGGTLSADLMRLPLFATALLSSAKATYLAPNQQSDLPFGTINATKGAQTFVGEPGEILRRFTCSLTKVGSPIDSLSAQLCGTSGGLPNEGDVLASATTSVTAATIPNGSFGYFSFEFADVPLGGGTYAIILTRSAGTDDDHYFRFGTSSADVVVGGKAFTRISSVWTDSGTDVAGVIHFAGSGQTLAASTQWIAQARAVLSGAENINLAPTRQSQIDFGNNANPEAAQTFVATHDVLKSFTCQLRVLGSPPDYIQAHLYSAIGDAPDTFIASGSLLDATTLNNLFQDYSFTFYNNQPLVPGAAYAIVLSRSGALDENDLFLLGLSSASTYANGRVLVGSPGDWSTTTTDAVGYIAVGSNSSLSTSASKTTAWQASAVLAGSRAVNFAPTQEVSVTFGRTTEVKSAQTFTATQDCLTTVRCQLLKFGSPTDDVNVSLYATSVGVPTGGPLIGVQISAASLTDSYVDYTFNFDNYPMVPGTKYAVVFERSGATSDVNYYKLAVALASHYPDGTYYFWDGDSWGDISIDIVGYVSGGLISSLSANLTPPYEQIATFAVASSLSAATRAKMFVSARFAEQAALAGNALRYSPISTRFAGAGSLSVSMAGAIRATTILAGAGALHFSPIHIAYIQAAFAGSSVLSADLMPPYPMGTAVIAASIGLRVNTIKIGKFHSNIVSLPVQSGTPAGWTKRNGTFTIDVVADDTTTGYSDRIVNASANSDPGQITWDEVGSQTGAKEILALVKITGTTVNGSSYISSVFHFQDSTDEGECYAIERSAAAAQFNEYTKFNNNTNNGSWQTSGGPFTIVPSAIPVSAWFWHRQKYDGVNFVAKFWQINTTEPVAFGSTRSDAFQSGPVGMYFDNTDSCVINYAAFSVGTGGVTAPWPPKYAPATTFAGAATFAANATVVEGVKQANADLAAIGTLQATAIAALWATADFAGASVFTASALRYSPVSAVFTGAGAVNAAAQQQLRGAATLLGAAALAADTRHYLRAAATLPAAAAIAVNARGYLRGYARIEIEEGFLSASALRFTPSSARLSGISTFSLNALRQLFLNERLAGSGNVVATTRWIAQAQAALPVSSALVVDVTFPAQQLSAVFVGAGVLAATARLKLSAAASLAGTSTLAASSRGRLVSTAAFRASSALAAAALLRQRGVAAFSGASAVSVTAWPIGVIESSALIAITSALSATTIHKALIQSQFALAGLLSATPKMRLTGRSRIDAVSDFAAGSAVLSPVRAHYAPVGTLSALGVITHRWFASTKLQGTAAIAATSLLFRRWHTSAKFVNASTFRAFAEYPIQPKFDKAKFAATGFMRASAGRWTHSSARYGAATRLAASAAFQFNLSSALVPAARFRAATQVFHRFQSTALLAATSTMRARTGLRTGMQPGALVGTASMAAVGLLKLPARAQLETDVSFAARIDKALLAARAGMLVRGGLTASLVQWQVSQIAIDTHGTLRARAWLEANIASSLEVSGMLSASVILKLRDRRLAHQFRREELVRADQIVARPTGRKITARART